MSAMASGSSPGSGASAAAVERQRSCGAAARGERHEASGAGDALRRAVESGAVVDDVLRAIDKQRSGPVARAAGLTARLTGVNIAKYHKTCGASREQINNSMEEVSESLE